MAITKLLVKRGRIGESCIVERPVPDLADGEILVSVGDFALTSNNITYAVMGDQLSYWRFFPEDDEWGIVPVWGFAEVTRSRHADVPVGARMWGYLPMASHLVMRPGKVKSRGFIDAAPHRDGLPLVYNHYAFTADEPPALAAAADMRSLYFPLFTTSYLIADYFADNGLFAAEQIIIGSASSKTGFATAHYLGALADRPAAIVGLTSPGNVGFAERLGVFDSVVAYGDVASLDPGVPTAYIDMSGDGAVLAAVHHHFGDNLRASIGVGATHWNAPRNRKPMPGAAPSFFFAPTQIAKRDAELGAGEVLRRAGTANLAFAVGLGDLLKITHHRGAAAVEARYQDMVNNRTPPTDGLILSFGNAA